MTHLNATCLINHTPPYPPTILSTERRDLWHPIRIRYRPAKSTNTINKTNSLSLFHESQTRITCTETLDYSLYIITQFTSGINCRISISVDGNFAVHHCEILVAICNRRPNRNSSDCILSILSVVEHIHRIFSPISSRQINQPSIFIYR